MEMKGEGTEDKKEEGIEGKEGEEKGLNGGYRGVEETIGREGERTELSRDSIERENNALEGGKQKVKEVNKMEVQDKGGVEGGGGEKTPQKDLVKAKALSPTELQKRADSLPQDSVSETVFVVSFAVFVILFCVLICGSFFYVLLFLLTFSSELYSLF